MRLPRLFLVTLFLTSGNLLSNLPAWSGEKAPPKVYTMAEELAAYGSDPVIIAAVKAQNAKGIPMEQIQELDKKWMAEKGIADYMKEIMANSCSQYLKTIQAKKSFLAEIFVMDNQGANVCQTDKTSDYWQGDEAKWQKSFNGGKGSLFVDEVKFDQSSQTNLAQVSVPVMEGGVAIGAITFGVSVDELP